MKKEFSKVFQSMRVAAAATLMTIFVSNASAQRDEYRAPESLTENETDLIKSIFGDSINTEGIQKRFVRQGLFFGIAACIKTDDASSIRILGQDRYSPDYALTDTTVLREYFVHEITHLLQLQRGGRRMKDYIYEDPNEIRGKYADYIYGVGRDSRFPQYNTEQQAAIVQDYMLRFRCYPPQPSRWLNMSAKDTPHRDMWLAKVVEDEFPDARRYSLQMADIRARSISEQVAKIASQKADKARLEKERKLREKEDHRTQLKLKKIESMAVPKGKK